jgi:hypothetical protein
MPKKFFAVLFIGFFFSMLSYQVIEIQNEPMNLWSKDLPTAECGIVLTGAPGRIREAFEYLAQKKIKKLIVSGVYKDSKLHEIFPYLPFYPEVSESQIYLEKKSETTFGNAQQSLVLSETLNCQRIVLMTSQIHMRRAFRVFKATFSDRTQIMKLSLPNSKTEKSYLDLGLEVLKSVFYFTLI